MKKTFAVEINTKIGNESYTDFRYILSESMEDFKAFFQKALTYIGNEKSRIVLYEQIDHFPDRLIFQSMLQSGNNGKTFFQPRTIRILDKSIGSGKETITIV